MNTSLASTTSVITPPQTSFSSGLSPSKLSFVTHESQLTYHSGAWLVLPSYMLYVAGIEILQGLTIAAGGTSEDLQLLKLE